MCIREREERGRVRGRERDRERERERERDREREREEEERDSPGTHINQYFRQLSLMLMSLSHSLAFFPLYLIIIG